MPKQKTHSGLKKRIKITATGKVKRSHAYTGHFATNKTSKQNRNLHKSAIMDSRDVKRINSVISNMR